MIDVFVLDTTTIRLLLKELLPAGAGCRQGAESGLSGGCTSTVTVAGPLSLVPSLTTSWKTRSVRTLGAVKLGVVVFAPLRVTSTPPIWDQV